MASFAASELEILQRARENGELQKRPHQKLSAIVFDANTIADTLDLTANREPASTASQDERIAVGELVADLVIYCALRDIDLSLCFEAFVKSTQPAAPERSRGVTP